MVKSLNYNKNDEDFIFDKQNSIVSSLFSSSYSSTSSLIENDDYDQNDDIELLPRSKVIKPRLSMQISHQLQY